MIISRIIPAGRSFFWALNLAPIGLSLKEKSLCHRCLTIAKRMLSCCRQGAPRVSVSIQRADDNINMKILLAKGEATRGLQKIAKSHEEK